MFVSNTFLSVFGNVVSLGLMEIWIPQCLQKLEIKICLI